MKFGQRFDIVAQNNILWGLGKCIKVLYCISHCVLIISTFNSYSSRSRLAQEHVLDVVSAGSDSPKM